MDVKSIEIYVDKDGDLRLAVYWRPTGASREHEVDNHVFAPAHLAELTKDDPYVICDTPKGPDPYVAIGRHGSLLKAAWIEEDGTKHSISIEWDTVPDIEEDGSGEAVLLSSESISSSED